MEKEKDEGRLLEGNGYVLSNFLGFMWVGKGAERVCFKRVLVCVCLSGLRSM